MSKLTVKLRKGASNGLIIQTAELLELISVVEEYELLDDDLTELTDKVAMYHKSSTDYQKKLSEIQSLPKYMFDKIHGVEMTPVGDYVSVEDIDDVVTQEPKCERCGVNFPLEPHPCPYESEINDDYEPCTCCQSCIGQCEQEI